METGQGDWLAVLWRDGETDRLTGADTLMDSPGHNGATVPTLPSTTLV